MKKNMLILFFLASAWLNAQSTVDSATRAYLDSIVWDSEVRSQAYTDSGLDAAKAEIYKYYGIRNTNRRTYDYSSDTTITYYRRGVKYTATYKKDRYHHYTHDFDAYFMPGLGYSIYKPANDTLGMYSGLNVEYLIYGRIHQDDEDGPSHTRFYAKLAILGNDKKRPSILMYGLGLNLSIERNPKRNFMVPYFGIETCAMSGRDFGSIFQFSPLVGFHVFSKENLYINLHGGYVYPTKNFENLKGYFGSASINFSLW